MNQHIASQQFRIELKELGDDSSALLDDFLVQQLARTDPRGSMELLSRHSSEEDEILMPQTNNGIHKHQLQLAPRCHNVLETRRIVQNLLVAKWTRRAEYERPLCSRQRLNRMMMSHKRRQSLLQRYSSFHVGECTKILGIGLKIPIFASVNS